jgi:F-type H+-transporting ATPase subunit b
VKSKEVVIFTLLLLVVACTSVAATGHSEGPVHVPWGKVGLQALNLSLLIVTIWYFVRRPVKSHFVEKREKFDQAKKEAQRAKEEAELKHQDIKSRMNHLETTAEEALANAQNEAEKQRRNSKNEATERAKNIVGEAHKSAEVEIQKAIQHLREELIGESMKKAKSQIANDLGETERAGLQKEFLEKIKVIG